jgi:hypothetical protein
VRGGTSGRSGASKSAALLRGIRGWGWGDTGRKAEFCAGLSSIPPPLGY